MVKFLGASEDAREIESKEKNQIFGIEFSFTPGPT
jgi:hypothetical protein